MFAVLTYFKGDVTDYVRAMYKYAAWKATYISSCLKKGETPIPGPASVQGSEEEDELNELLKQLDNAPNPHDPLGTQALFNKILRFPCSIKFFQLVCKFSMEARTVVSVGKTYAFNICR